MKRYDKIKITFNDGEKFEESDIRVEVNDKGIIHVCDALDDEWLFSMNNIKKVFLKKYSDIPKEIGE